MQCYRPPAVRYFRQLEFAAWFIVCVLMTGVIFIAGDIAGWR